MIPKRIGSALVLAVIQSPGVPEDVRHLVSVLATGFVLFTLLVANAVMSQHMHDMTADDHVLTVLPMFHVGGLNIQTTPALQLGATVTVSSRTPGTTVSVVHD